MDKIFEVYANYTISASTEEEARKLFLAGNMLTVREARPKVYSPRMIHALLELDHVTTAEQESFIVFLLDTQQQILSRHTVSIGTLNASMVHPREVFKHAIRENAAAVIIAHNHPSGGREPSDEDITVTKRLKEAGQLLGITLLDHIIVFATGFYSLKEHGEV